MRTASKLVLLALLALPAGSVFAAATDTLTVTITVTVNATVDVVFWDGAAETTTQTWTIANATLGSSHDSAVDGVVTNIKNKAGFKVDLTARGSNPAIT